MPEINIENGKAELKQMNLSAIADSISYVKLSTPDSVYLSDNLNIKLYETHILIFDKSTKGVFLFDRAGNYIRSISSIGEKDIEYLEAVDCVADEKNKVIYILDIGQQKVATFSFSGNFIGSFKIPGFPLSIIFKNDSFFFITPSCGKSHQKRWPDIYKTDLNGKVVREFMHNEEYVQNRLANYSTYVYKDTLTFWQQSSDTIFYIDADLKMVPKYIIKDKDLMPKSKLFSTKVRNFLGQHFVIDKIIETEHFCYFEGIYKLHDAVIIHNKLTGENFNLLYNLDIWDHGFLNDLDGGPPFRPQFQSNEKVLYSYLKPRDFLNVYEHPYTQNIKALHKDWRHKLGVLAKKIDLKDNGIIQIVYLK
ncbi:hypothetical protein A3860_33065 [Niastella vici]|uniref:6-bladed beta-propeller n=2 Tax=Niastella vici TaxID=1703345 RepID=A0A1V9FQ47_9BACT|nr:hypothetical protein A3860_33065 [Niastella vici]